MLNTLVTARLFSVKTLDSSNKMRSKNIHSDGHGNGPDSDFINRTLERFRELQFYDSLTIKWEQTTRGVRAHAKIPPAGGGSGWDWMYPTNKELDTTLPYSAGKWVYISALNTLVTTGMTDIVSNANVISCQGLWECAQDVPAAVGGKFNVPVFPYPAAPAIPSGTPLKGDLDDPLIFWIYRGDVT